MARRTPRSTPAATPPRVAAATHSLPAARPSSIWLVAAATVVAVAVLLLHVRHYLPFLADDALISLRYARRLLEGHGLTWTEGPRVEGYSNLLWVLMTSALGAAGIGLVTAARALGVACVVAAVVTVGASQTRAGGSCASPGEAFAGALAGGLAVALAGPIAVWAGAGLEGPLVAALLAVAVFLAIPLFASEHPGPRPALVASVPLALLVLARPDGPLFTATFVLALLLARGFKPGVIALGARLAALPLLAFAGQEIFRLIYYHSWVPNPARLKVAFTMNRLVSGAEYVGRGLESFWPLWLLAIAGAVAGFRRPGERGVTWLVVVPLVAWTGYIVVIGGDFFPGYRFLIPTVVLAGFLVAAAGRSLWRRQTRPVVGLMGITGLLALFGTLQLSDPENARANREVWVWAGESTGLMLKRAFGEARPLLAVVSAGCFPYWSELPSLDMLGLNDDYIPRHPPPRVGEGWPGHEFGDGRYVLAREPDLVQFSGIRKTGRTGYFRVEQELAQSPGFQARYTMVNFEATEPRPATQALYVRRDSPRIGIVRREGEVRVPAYLFAFNWRTTATLDPEGRPGVEVSREQPAALAGLALGHGLWRVRLEPEREGFVVGFAPAGTGGRYTILPEGGAIPLDRDGKLDLLVTASAEGDRLHLREVVLTREGP